MPDVQPGILSGAAEAERYEVCRVSVEELALYLKPLSGAKGTSRPQQCMLGEVFLLCVGGRLVVSKWFCLIRTGSSFLHQPVQI